MVVVAPCHISGAPLAGQSAQLSAQLNDNPGSEEQIDYDQLNLLLTLHYQKFYGDTQANQEEFQTIRIAQQVIYQRHAQLVKQMQLKNDREILIEAIAALQESMLGYGHDKLDLNGLKSASVLGGGTGVCEHIAPAYAEILNAINPDFAAESVLVITRDTSFQTGFSTLPKIKPKLAPVLNNPDQDQTAFNISATPGEVTAHSGALELEAAEPTSPAAIFQKTKPDHMITAAQITLGSHHLTIFIDPTNPSFWYSDGTVIRNLIEPEIYMLYSQLGQAVYYQKKYQAVGGFLAQTQLTAQQIQALQILLSPDRVTHVIQHIHTLPQYVAGVQTLSTPSFRHLYQTNYLAQQQ